MEENIHHYQQDLLGESYERTTLHLKHDDEGPVVATLVRKKNFEKTRKAALYVHGYIDYFFQTEMAEQFNLHGYDFYALDLRKYGRSYLPHQSLFHVKDIKEYDEEISLSLDMIEKEGHDCVVMCGHSTGGLTMTYYTIRHPHHSLIKALWLNSPFYDFNTDMLTKKIGLPLVGVLAKLFPNLRMPNGLNKHYARSLHKDHLGEWDFNLDWKPLDFPYSSISFIRAVHQVHQVLASGSKINVPTLVMYSKQSKNPKEWSEDIAKSDLVLNVKDIEEKAKKLYGDITTMSIENGIHDLVLSSKDVRNQVYQSLFSWLQEKGV
ncbi:alpha/beta hydrolase [Sphingobacterium sp. SRCM116780]|uniref:alpha/beta hydrolase n=1 Tax=Sphingobacterium sp. SRCM116780 TaxID=2907623 RepID=UPI001F1B2288|nr:alpha/beta hydrolase [Sphingobacterium sp. SRCM116780]UIR54907.1 alpha/beta hydrolase [Sphingobacterium sp. SRCM116780]